MQTLKLSSIIISCLILILLSFIFVNWVFIIFIIPIIIYLFLGIFTFEEQKLDIEVKRDISKERVFENDEVKIKLEITNKGKNINNLEIYDEIPEKIKIINGSNYAQISLKKNHKITLEYSILCELRGLYPIGPVNLRTKDFFEIFYNDQTINLENYIMALPYLEEIRNIPIRSKANMFPGAIHSKQAGMGIDFYGIRKYLPGDNYKNINWKSYARFNDLMVNEFSLESTTDVIIIVDSRETEKMGSLKYNPLEYSIKAAGSLASFFLNRRDRVGFISYGKKEGEIKWVYPESGKKQLHKIVENLVEIEGYGTNSLNSILNQAFTRMIPKKSLIFFISSLQNDNTISEGIEKLMRLGFQTIILSPSSIDIEILNKDIDDVDQISYKILNFERKNNLSQLRNIGAIVIDWNPSTPLMVQLEEVGKYQLAH